MPYITAAQVRARYSDLKDSIAFSDAAINETVLEFEEVAEEYLGEAFTPRTVTEVVALGNQRYLSVHWPKIRTVTSIVVTYLGSVVTLDSAVWLIDANSGVVDLGGSYYGNATIVYSHGDTTPNQRITSACYEYVRSTLLRRRTGLARDVIVQGGDQSGTRYNTPNIKERRPTGWSEVDRLLNSADAGYRQARNLG